LAVLHAALTVGDFSGSGRGFLFFDFFERDGAGDDVGEELEIVEAGYGVGCEVLVDYHEGGKKGKYKDLGIGCCGGVCAQI
jgi:hypothetical protein